MSEQNVLVTGACGEIGQALVQKLIKRGGYRIVTNDLAPLPVSLHGQPLVHVQGDLLLKVKQFYAHRINMIYHLAASLSSKAEAAPEIAHRINVEGTLELLQLAAYQSEQRGEAVKFIFPGSIAAYGLPDTATKEKAGRIAEEQYNCPRTMYGCNKLYCEKLGVYYSCFIGQRHLDPRPPVMLDFRALRFPGLISAFTLPSGGTTDFGPEMLHAAAQGEAYACFVREDTALPFMAMPDAVKSMLVLADAPRQQLSQQVYNVGAFSMTAGDFKKHAVEAFPDVRITFEPNIRRQGIVDSWPADVDDTLARKDWGWQPAYDEGRFFDDYFLPEIKQRYGNPETQ